MALSIPHDDFQSGAIIVAAQHNANNAAIMTAVNGNLDTNSLKANAGIVDTQLATISTAGKVSGTAITSGAIGVNALGNALDKKEVIFLIDGAGSAIQTGIKGDIRFPAACTLTAWYLLADQTGSIKIDLWKDTLANYPPTDADTITNGHEPEISSATNASDTDIADWTGEDSVVAGDIIRVNVDSCSTITRCSLVLQFTRTA